MGSMGANMGSTGANRDLVARFVAAAEDSNWRLVNCADPGEPRDLPVPPWRRFPLPDPVSAEPPAGVLVEVVVVDLLDELGMG